MKLSPDKVNELCKTRGLRLKSVLSGAGVSRTAYYSLTRKDSVLPKSMVRLARQLDVSPVALLEDDSERIRDLRRLQEAAESVYLQHPGCDRDVVFRTLQNLQLPPVERLRRALHRAGKYRIHG
jgi:hypothetical protein